MSHVDRGQKDAVESETPPTGPPAEQGKTETPVSVPAAIAGATVPAEAGEPNGQTSEAGTETGAKPAISPDLVDSLLLEDLSSIMEKVKNKKPLTANEIKRLTAYKTAKQDSETPDPMQPVWASSQAQLATMLGCSRRQVQRFLKIEGEEAAPAPTSDGRYNVTLWKIWASEHGHLRKQLSQAADRQMLEDRQVALRNEKLEIENAVRRGELMDVDEVCRTITEMVSGTVDTARTMKHALAPRVVGLTVPEATKRIGQEMDHALTKLSLGEWAKKKPFWSKVSAHLSDLHKRFNLGDGLSATS